VYVQALGRHSEAVFVDSERTAKEAIQYLKDQHIPAMTFVPVTTCKVT
jgi:structural maintenance of chromosome 1